MDRRQDQRSDCTQLCSLSVCVCVYVTPAPLLLLTLVVVFIADWRQQANERTSLPPASSLTDCQLVCHRQASSSFCCYLRRCRYGRSVVAVVAAFCCF